MSIPHGLLLSHDKDHKVETNNVNTQADRAHTSTFAGVASPPPALGLKEFNQTNPMPAGALLQSPHVLRKVLQSSQDNLAANAGNITITLPDMLRLPSPFTPPGTQCGVGAVIKTVPTVLTKKKPLSSDGEGSAMGVDQPTPPALYQSLVSP